MGGLISIIQCLLIVITFFNNLTLGGEIDYYMNLPPPEIDSTEYGTTSGDISTNCSCGWTNKDTKRIVGGLETGINEYPLIAALADGIHGVMKCGASIITAYHALTAAHCTVDEKDKPLVVIVGEHDVMTDAETDATRQHKVKTVIEHEDYNRKFQQNDIALLTLETKIDFTDKVGPACLPTSSMDLVDEFVKVLGWGRLRRNGRRSRALQQVNLRVIPLKVCADTFTAEIPTDNPHQLCTFNFGKDACQGDSGGPLIWHDPDTNMYTQVGIVSYGSGCGSDSPAVSTDLSYFISWIHQKIAETQSEAYVCTKQ